MAGGGSGVSEDQFKGWQKQFNTFTLRGRANIAFATFGTIATIFIFFKLKPKKKPVQM